MVIWRTEAPRYTYLLTDGGCVPPQPNYSTISTTYETARSESAGRFRACQHYVNNNAGAQRRKTAPQGSGWRPASRPDQVEQIVVGETGAEFGAIQEVRGEVAFRPDRSREIFRAGKRGDFALDPGFRCPFPERHPRLKPGSALIRHSRPRIQPIAEYLLAH